MSIPFMYKKNNNGATSSLTVYVDGKSHTLSSSAGNFEMILTALKNGNDDEVRKSLNFKEVIADFSHGQISLYGDELHFDGEPLHNAISSRIIELYREGFDIKPMSLFLENLMKNPSKDTIKELYGFLEFSDLPITDDGHFLAYRVVRHDYKDKHSGTMDNSIGQTVRMKREDCDSNRSRTCSRGLHFCSKDYVSHFYDTGDHLLIVKINPKDVVSIPNDYNNTKGRCCEFYVQEEIEDTSFMKKWYAPSSSNFELDEEYYDDDDDNDWEEEEDDSEDWEKEITKDIHVGTNNPSSKLTEENVRKIRKMLGESFTLKAIADMFNVHPRTIGRIRDGEIWSHVR